MSRQSHYQIYFGDNKKNSKALCQENHEIIYSKKKNPNKNNFSTKPIKPEEICDIIKTLKNSKSTSPNSIPAKILKIIKNSISIPLSTLINKSFENGTFPNVCNSKGSTRSPK